MGWVTVVPRSNSSSCVSTAWARRRREYTKGQADAPHCLSEPRVFCEFLQRKVEVHGYGWVPLIVGGFCQGGVRNEAGLKIRDSRFCSRGSDPLRRPRLAGSRAGAMNMASLLGMTSSSVRAHAHRLCAGEDQSSDCEVAVPCLPPDPFCLVFRLSEPAPGSFSRIDPDPASPSTAWPTASWHACCGAAKRRLRLERRGVCPCDGC